MRRRMPNWGRGQTTIWAPWRTARLPKLRYGASPRTFGPVGVQSMLNIGCPRVLLQCRIGAGMDGGRGRAVSAGAEWRNELPHDTADDRALRLGFAMGPLGRATSGRERRHIRAAEVLRPQPHSTKTRTKTCKQGQEHSNRGIFFFASRWPRDRGSSEWRSWHGNAGMPSPRPPHPPEYRRKLAPGGHDGARCGAAARQSIVLLVVVKARRRREWRVCPDY